MASSTNSVTPGASNPIRAYDLNTTESMSSESSNENALERIQEISEGVFKCLNCGKITSSIANARKHPWCENESQFHQLLSEIPQEEIAAANYWKAFKKRTFFNSQQAPLTDSPPIVPPQNRPALVRSFAMSDLNEARKISASLQQRNVVVAQTKNQNNS